jgi:hypothetical protein
MAWTDRLVLIPPKARLPGKGASCPLFGEGGCPIKPGRVRGIHFSAGDVGIPTPRGQPEPPTLSMPSWARPLSAGECAASADDAGPQTSTIPGPVAWCA